MIVREKPNAFHLFFVTRGSIILEVLPKILFVSSFAAAIVLLDHYWAIIPHISLPAFGVFGIALSLFLGFRNNAAYDRWWEARQLWGRLVGDCRNFARDCQIFLPEVTLRRPVLIKLMGYITAHRLNLQGKFSEKALAPHLSADFIATLNHDRPACGVLNSITADLSQCRNEQSLTDMGARALSERLGFIAMSQAGCERIATTPLPFVYSLLVRRTAYLYCFLVPFALVGEAGWLSPIFSAVIAYIFFGLSAVTNQLEHPFSDDENCLPLETLSRVIENSILENLGEESLPAIKAENYVLR